ncbi:MAG: 2-oxoacid:acceptor oxidoreductase family protein [Candidatus Aenigmatarchaeota archaeon]
MFEVRIHGRGGQGIKMSSNFLARAYFLSGFYTQNFAMYGAERRGAPVVSFVRSDRKIVLERGYVFEPDTIIIFDETLDFKKMLKGLKRNSFILLNSPNPASFFRKKFRIRNKAYAIDATEVALELIGKPIANAALMGAAVKILGMDFKKLEEAIRIELTEAGHPEAIPKNIEAAKRCYEMVG